jgi:hypothetical protein
MRHTSRRPSVLGRLLFVAALLVAAVTAAPGRAVAATSTPVTAGGPEVVVMPLHAPALDPTVRDAFEDAIHASVGTRAPPALRGRPAMRALLADVTAGGLTCALDDIACAARVGVIADVKLVVLADLFEDGAMRMYLVEVASARPTIVVVDRPQLPAKDSGVSIRAIVDRLFEPPARADLDVQPAGSKIFVDGIPVGVSPLLEPVGLSLGPHDVRAEPESGPPEVRKIVLDAPGRSTVAIAPPTAPAPVVINAPQRDPLSSPLFIAGAVTAGLGVLGTIGCAAVVGYAEYALGTPAKGEDREGLRQLGVGFAVGAAVSVVAGVMGAALVGGSGAL